MSDELDAGPASALPELVARAEAAGGRRARGRAAARGRPPQANRAGAPAASGSGARRGEPLRPGAARPRPDPRRTDHGLWAYCVARADAGAPATEAAAVDPATAARAGRARRAGRAGQPRAARRVRRGAAARATSTTSPWLERVARAHEAVLDAALGARDDRAAAAVHDLRGRGRRARACSTRAPRRCSTSALDRARRVARSGA